jgi:two-component system, NtrC family, sensor kinase
LSEISVIMSERPKRNRSTRKTESDVTFPPAAPKRPTPGTALHAVSEPLAALAEISSALASALAPDEIISRVLDELRRTLAADDCTVWVYGSHGLERGWSAGHAPVNTAAREVLAAVALEDDETELVARGIGHGPGMLGVMSASVGRSLTADERTLLTVVARLLAPVLASPTRTPARSIAAIPVTEDERRFTQRIIDSLPVGLYVIDREYRIRVWNRKRETGMQGVSREEAIGRTIFEVLHRQPADTLRREFDDVFRTGRVSVFHMESKASGEARTYRISKIPMRLDDAGVTHVITIGEDVTEWKDAQERVAQAEKLAAIGQLAAGAMHEINNPLATIAACAESLLLRIDDMRAAGIDIPADTGEFLHIVEGEVQRCTRIVDGLLDFSRPRPSTKKPTDVNSAVERTLFLLKHHTRFKKLRVETHLDQSLPTVQANAEQLVQVFMALLLNAVDAMNEKGTVTIRTRAGRDASEGVVTEVVDEGIGIPRGETAKIFEPFFTTKAPGRGTGLGLSICYGIVSDHGGHIEVDSTPGVGSTFRVLLPAIVEAAQ